MIKFESEKLLEDYICSKLDEAENIIDGRKFDTYKRQYKCGNYGIADIVTFTVAGYGDSEWLEINIYELKNEGFSSKVMAQVSRYYTYFKNLAEEKYEDLDIHVYASIICYDSGITDDDYILNNDDHAIPVYKYYIDPDKGFTMFRAQGCKLIEECLSECEHINNLMVK